MSNPIKSASVSIKPRDGRCRYWAKIIRSGKDLPLPADVDGANDLPSEYLRKGEEELLPGDFLFEGEEEHHRKARGWAYWLTYCDEEGVARRITRPGAEEKAALKAAGIPVEYLPGSGGVAAIVRVAQGVRLGLIKGEEI